MKPIIFRLHDFFAAAVVTGKKFQVGRKTSLTFLQRGIFFACLSSFFVSLSFFSFFPEDQRETSDCVGTSKNSDRGTKNDDAMTFVRHSLVAKAGCECLAWGKPNAGSFEKLIKEQVNTF